MEEDIKASGLERLHVVLLHDWLTGVRGAEKVLDVFCKYWPHAYLFTLLHKKDSTLPSIEALRPHVSLLGRLPFIARYYRNMLPLMPLAIELQRFPSCDLMVSSSYCVVKSAHVPKGAIHICYCHTPMRYAWFMQGYSEGWGRVKKGLIAGIMAWLRAWDRRTARRVTHFIANSKTVQQRIMDCYGRSSEVIYPPVDTDYYCLADIPREDFYLIVSAFAPYKRLDLAIEACKRMNRRLIIIGEGQQSRKLQACATSGVEFLGRQPGEVILDHMRRCRALLFPGEEDFGIVPVEAQACGAPVIAFGRGGATETVIPWGDKNVSPTGVWFNEQTPESMIAAINLLEKHLGDFDPQQIRRHSEQFNHSRFKSQIFGYITRVMGSR